jgi:hypothetical protein
MTVKDKDEMMKEDATSLSDGTVEKKGKEMWTRLPMIAYGNKTKKSDCGHPCCNFYEDSCYTCKQNAAAKSEGAKIEVNKKLDRNINFNS